MNNGPAIGTALYNVAHTRIKGSFVGDINSNTELYAYNSKVIELDSFILSGNVKFIALDTNVSKLISRYSKLSGNALYPNGIINQRGAALKVIN